jgi:pre-mRNA branch site protein p14
MWHPLKLVVSTVPFKFVANSGTHPSFWVLSLLCVPQSKLPPEVNRILYVRNLPFTISAEELYAIFGKYGAVFQIRLGNKDKDTRGTAFVVYEDIYDAKAAVDHLSGFNVGGRYLVVLYYQPAKFQKRTEVEEKEKDLQLLRKKVQQHKSNKGK